MEVSSLKILSFNLAGETLFLHHLLSEDKPDILLVQEVLLSTRELQIKVQPYGYKCESNVDALNPTKPGTASITSVLQVDKAFCDDETIIGTNINDVTLFEELMTKFESIGTACANR